MLLLLYCCCCAVLEAVITVLHQLVFALCKIRRSHLARLPTHPHGANGI
mgnify:CR=1 FL=1